MCKAVYSVKGCSKRFPDLPNEILLHRYSSFDLIGVVLINWINDEMGGMSPRSSNASVLTENEIF